MQYTVPLGDLGELGATADYYHSSPLSFVNTSLPAYDLVNARLDWRNVAGRPMDIGIYVTNAFKENYQAIGAVSGGGLGFNTAIYGAPRQYGLTLRYRFGS
nr:TonB-dependent receptor [Sphingobium sp.]